MKKFGFNVLNFFLFVKSLYNIGNIFDICVRLFWDSKVEFKLYFESKLYLFWLVKVFFLLCNRIIFFFFDRNVFDKILFLNIIFWYVIMIFVFVMLGFIILFLYL